MENRLGLDLSMQQQLKINAQLLQTMETLTLSAEQLREKVEKEAETNPVMILHDNEASFDAISRRYRSETDRTDSYSDNEPYDSGDRPNWIEGMVSEKEDLKTHLLAQLGLVRIPDDVKKAAATLITAMDRNGFVGEDPESLLPDDEKQCTEEALNVIQQLEPAGVGARDWKESLVIQAEAKGMKGQELSTFKSFVYDELDNLRLGRTDAIARDLRVEKEDVEAFSSFLRTLTPFPGRQYGSEYEKPVIPELSIKTIDGKLTLSLNSDAIPLFEIDESYKQMREDLKKEKREDAKDASRFLKEKLQSAESLKTQIEARRSALIRLGTFLMEKQQDFFMKGPVFLKSLTMKEAADEIGVHEATVSRLASSKYIDTDFGIYPIRMMFSTQVASSDGENYSKNAVKEMIRTIIDENRTGKALSDQKISDMLAERGIKAARRTVAKYRKELDISSSFDRPN